MPTTGNCPSFAYAAHNPKEEGNMFFFFEEQETRMQLATAVADDDDVSAGWHLTHI